MNTKKFLLSLAIAIIIPLCLSPQITQAGGHEGGGGASTYIKLEPFTVNLQGLTQILQVGITLKGASPEAGETINTHLPIIRHALILLLSSKEAAQISTLKGKTALGEEAKKPLTRQ